MAVSGEQAASFTHSTAKATGEHTEALRASYWSLSGYRDLMGKLWEVMGKRSEDANGVYPLVQCPKCNLRMRLSGIEPEKPGRDLFTFECSGCGRVEVMAVPIH